MNSHSLYHSLLSLAFYKKAPLGLLLLVLFLLGLSCSSISDSEKGLSMVSLLFDILSWALLLNALSLASSLLITLSWFSLLVDTFSLVSFLFNTLVLLLAVLFDSLTFYFLFRIEERVHFFCPSLFWHFLSELT